MDTLQQTIERLCLDLRPQPTVQMDEAASGPQSQNDPDLFQILTEFQIHMPKIAEVYHIIILYLSLSNSCAKFQIQFNQSQDSQTWAELFFSRHRFCSKTFRENERQDTE